MFTDTESYNIEHTKNSIKSLITTRNLLWNGITQNVVIAGGFFTSALQNKPFKDIDIFILDNDVAVFNAFTHGFQNQNIKEKVKQDMMKARSSLDDLDFLDSERIFDNGEAQEPPEWSRSEMMAYMHNPNIVDVINNHRTQAQYILTKYKTREELLDHFDYKHCKVSYVPSEDKLYINRETYDCIWKKILKVNNEQPAQQNQVYRRNNFLNKGWVFEKDLEQPNVLTRDLIKESYQQLKEQLAAKALDAYSTSSPVPYSNQGFVAQTVDEILKSK